MKLVSKIEIMLREFCLKKKSQIKTSSELDKKIITDALPAYEDSLKKQSASRQPNIGRLIMKGKITKLAVAAAIILIAIIFGINFTGTPIDGASTAFAAAMDSIKQARTFLCIEIFEMSYHDDEKEGKYLLKQKWMFMEPDLERHEELTSPWEKFEGEITIWDYSKRQRLMLRPFEKKAILRDLSYSYEVNDKTGQLQLTELDTSLRDRLLELSMGTFEDLGHVELDGKSVLKLESEKNGRVTTIWIDPKTNYPVQIEHKWPGQERSPILYTEIKIDVELDDELFSLEPPEDYELEIDSGTWPKDKSKLATKIRNLGLLCAVYAIENNNKFPDKFEDIVTSGVTNENVLKNLLAAPDDPNGESIFRYRKPDLSILDTDDKSIEVIVYEDYEGKSNDEEVAVAMLDSHTEFLPVQTLKELLKPWPAYQKNLVNKMTLLHSGCIKYAKEHEGRFPNELSELVDGIFLERVIKLLLSAPGQQDGPAVIQYIPPRSDRDISTNMVLFELYDQWPEDGIVVCFGDGHCEMITDQNVFEHLVK